MCIQSVGNITEKQFLNDFCPIDDCKNIKYGKISVDTNYRTVTYEGKLVYLHPKEYSLFLFLLKYPQQIFSTEALIERLWNIEKIPTHSSVRSHIKGLRKAFKEAGATEEIITTIHGFGYRLAPLVQEPREKKVFLPPAAVLNNFIKAKSIDYIIVDLTGKIIYNSPGVCKHLGAYNTIFLGLDIEEALPIPKEYRGDFQKLLSREVNTLIIRDVPVKADTSVTQYINLYAIVDGSSEREQSRKQNLFIFLEDASEIMLYKQKLHQEENKLESRPERAE